jgi:branched-chain amino acid transport system substrate-binding protein
MAPAAKGASLSFTTLAVSSSAPSYTAQCVQLQQENVNYAIISFTAAAAVKFVQDCQAQGYNPTWGTNEQSINNSFLSLPDLTAYSAAYAFPSTADAPPVATFRSAMEKYATNSNWKEGTGSFTWDGLQALGAALKTAAAGGATPTSAQVENSLYGLKGSTLSGELANPIGWVKGQPAGFKYNPCYFLEEVKGGKLLAPQNLAPQCPTA